MYGGYVGPGRRISSPGLRSAARIISMPSDIPEVTMMSSGEISMLLTLFSFWLIASLSSGSPSDGE